MDINEDNDEDNYEDNDEDNYEDNDEDNYGDKGLSSARGSRFNQSEESIC